MTSGWENLGTPLWWWLLQPAQKCDVAMLCGEAPLRGRAVPCQSVSARCWPLGPAAVREERRLTSHGKRWVVCGKSIPQLSLARLPARRWLSSRLLRSSLFPACARAGGWAGGRSVRGRPGAKQCLLQLPPPPPLLFPWAGSPCCVTLSTSSLTAKVFLPPAGIYVGLYNALRRRLFSLFVLPLSLPLCSSSIPLSAFTAGPANAGHTPH